MEREGVKRSEGLHFFFTPLSTLSSHLLCPTSLLFHLFRSFSPPNIYSSHLLPSTQYFIFISHLASPLLPPLTPTPYLLVLGCEVAAVVVRTLVDDLRHGDDLVVGVAHRHAQQRLRVVASDPVDLVVEPGVLPTSTSHRNELPETKSKIFKSLE